MVEQPTAEQELAKARAGFWEAVRFWMPWIVGIGLGSLFQYHYQWDVWHTIVAILLIVLVMRK